MSFHLIGLYIPVFHREVSFFEASTLSVPTYIVNKTLIVFDQQTHINHLIRIFKSGLECLNQLNENTLNTSVQCQVSLYLHVVVFVIKNNKRRTCKYVKYK